MLLLIIVAVYIMSLRDPHRMLEFKSIVLQFKKITVMIISCYFDFKVKL